MRKSIIAVAALSALTWSTVAWAVLDTSVTITNEGQPVPGATISVSTSEGPTPKPVKKSDSSGKVPVRYDEKKVKPRRTRVHLTVRARVPTREGTTREVTRDVDVSMETLISGQLVIDLVSGAPPGAPPVTNAPGDWPGTYVGGGAGGRWTQCPDFTTAALSTGGPVSPGGPVAPGGGTTPGDPTFAPGAGNQGCGSSGFRGSIMLGTNWQVAPQWVVGIEGDVGLGNSTGTITGIPGAPNVIVPAAGAGNDSVNMKEGWDAGLRARGGYLVTPWMLVFGTAGVAWQRIEATLNCSTAGACGFNGIPAFSATNSTVRTGYSVGGGVDVKLAGNWSARGEYRYSDYGTWRTVLGSPATLAVTTDIRMRTHTALFGVAYTFAGLPQ
jgi:outer membrane immunogenic protein